MNHDAENWSDYWRDEGAGGEVCVKDDGSLHPALSVFWQNAFLEGKAGDKIIDIACGGGSVLSHISGLAERELFGADISDEAIRILTRRFPFIQGLVCPAIAIPMEGKSFDHVVSQYGIEYAGLEAFVEAARLVKNGGKFTALCHYQDGTIDSRNAIQLAGVKWIADHQFVDRAISFFERVYEAGKKTDGAERIAELVATFQTTLSILEQHAAGQPTSVATHLHAGFLQLYNRRHAYLLTDITGWLDGMHNEVDMAITRLSHMRAAALNEGDINEIKEIFSKSGFSSFTARPFVGDGEKVPMAWAIKAVKTK